MDDLTRILVTGSTGFVGSHLVSRLVGEGFDVFSLERYVTGRYALGQTREVKTVFGDLRDAYWVKKAIREVQPAVVVHLASISPVSYSYDHPQEVLETNLVGTINLAEACLHEVANFKQFLFSSTSETYGNGPTPKNEETPQNPNSPYAVSKVTAEKYLRYMLYAYDFPVTILRNFNTYGRKNNSHFVVERIISQMLSNETVRLGDPNPIRDLVYIDDHVNAYLSCLNQPRALGEAFNFCTGIGTSIKELAEIVSKLTNFHGRVLWNTIPKRPLDIEVLVGDFRKAEKFLGWKPQFRLENGLEKTIEFWKNRISTQKLSTVDHGLCHASNGQKLYEISNLSR